MPDTQVQQTQLTQLLKQGNVTAAFQQARIIYYIYIYTILLIYHIILLLCLFIYIENYFKYDISFLFSFYFTISSKGIEIVCVFCLDFFKYHKSGHNYFLRTAHNDSSLTLGRKHNTKYMKLNFLLLTKLGSIACPYGNKCIIPN